MDEINIPRLAREISSEADAYAYLERLRWGSDLQRQVCPHEACGSDRKFYFLKPKNGTSRSTRTGASTQRRVWKCADCRKQFSVLTGTIFHGTKIPVQTWLMVIFEMCASKNGVAAREIERKYDLTAKSAWYMLHRIREAMKRGPLAGLLAGGTLIADETYIGGSDKNRHKAQREQIRPYEKHATRWNDKTPVLSLIDKETGEVRSRVVPDVTGATLSKTMSELGVNKSETALHTDGHTGYKAIASEFAAHEAVDHREGEYVRGDVTTNHAEGYFSQLKRSLDGTHHRVSADHLPRYLAEFDFRYSTRQQSDTERMARLMGQTAGRRLSYRPLTGPQGV